MKLRIPTILIFRSYLLVFRWGAGESNSPMHPNFHGHDAPWDAPLIASRRAVVPSSALKQQTNRGEFPTDSSAHPKTQGAWNIFFKIPTSFLFFFKSKNQMEEFSKNPTLGRRLLAPTQVWSGKKNHGKEGRQENPGYHSTHQQRCESFAKLWLVVDVEMP